MLLKSVGHRILKLLNSKKFSRAVHLETCSALPLPVEAVAHVAVVVESVTAEKRLLIQDTLREI